MSIQGEIGRTIVGSFPDDAAKEIAEYLICNGIDAIVCHEKSDDLYHVAVPEKDAEIGRKFIAEKLSFSGSNCQGKEKAPTFKRISQHLNDIAGSAALFLICGGMLFVLAFLKVIHVIASNGESSFMIWFELIIGFVFILLGIRILFKAHIAKKNIRAESRYTMHVIEWFLGTYSSKDLDRMVLRVENKRGINFSPAEERRGLIREYIAREFAVDDPEYLDYLTTEVYLAMYESRKIN